jgi:phosphate-selective porin OprO/OprP
MSGKNMFSKLLLLAGGCVALGATSLASAGVEVYRDGDKSVELGARLQLQYHRTDPDVGASEDEWFFRRLRPYIQGTVTSDWEGKFQFDLGKSSGDNEVAVKDAYMAYSGWKNTTVYIGNTKTVFSREFLTSSKRQQMIERSFVGDHNYGGPDRQLGFRLDTHNDDKTLMWKVNLGSESIDPDARKLDFDTPANDSPDFNQGTVVAARVDIHPRGEMKFDQGDFYSDSGKFSFSLAAFAWRNDDDNNTYTVAGASISGSKADIDNANGFEVSAGYRGQGFSIDGQYNKISADTVVGTFSGGLYRNGSTDLDAYALEAGYMIPNSSFEVIIGAESLDADNYATPWDRTSVGLNYFMNKHKAKIQFTWRMGSNIDGVRGADSNEAFVQFQFVL